MAETEYVNAGETAIRDRDHAVLRALKAEARVAELETAIREHRMSSTFSITEGVYCARDAALYAVLKGERNDV